MKLTTALTAVVALASQALASNTNLSCSSVPCGQPKVVHFDEFPRGEYLASDTYAACGIDKLVCRSKGTADSFDRECRIFDTELAYGEWSATGSDPLCSSGSCTLGDCGDDNKKNKCGDPDLVAPFVVMDSPTHEEVNPGKVIIYDEVWAGNGYTDAHGSHVYPPDDNANGARFIFEFTNPVSIHKVEYLDIEESTATITFFYSNSGSSTVNVEPVDDGKMRIVNYSETYVKKIEIKLVGSGAVSSIEYTEQEICPPVKPGGGGGDPHLQLWGREKYSFHGECDLVMVHSEQFHDSQGLDLHIRTTINDYYSYIESAALRIGSSVLELEKESFLLNGAEHTTGDLPLVFGNDEYKYTLSQVTMENKNYNIYKLDLGSSTIVFKFYKHFLTISIDGHEVDFGDSVGLLGDYTNGEMIGRDGRLIHDAIDFGFEWQVHADEPRLFRDARSPQLPYEKCRMPSVARPSRRKLRGALLALHDDAHEACAAQKGNDFELCVQDVMATGDLGLATVW